MKQSYFPYLPNSRIEDNKRYKFINDMMEKNPFAFHKRKNISSSFDNYIIKNNNNFNNFNGNNINQELLFFQKDNDKYIDSYNSFMKQKSSTIENNAQKYLNYLSQNKISLNLNNKTNFFQNNNNDNISVINNTLPVSSEFKERKNRLHENRSAKNINSFPLRNNLNIINNNNSIEVNKKNFIPSIIKARGSDITNPFFYDHIAKEIIKKNQETMNYNIKESENKFIKKKKLFKYSDDKLALAPGKINNPKYYSLGESVLDKNPILNKGQYSPSFTRNYKYFSRYPNIFDT